jgi:gamma-glutamyltranspeptidase/glutathione hydrolase
MSFRQLFCLAALPLVLSQAQERTQARSVVMTSHGIVATSQTLASQAGAQVLARGGSAVDAAIAANAMLGLVEPMMDGIGGDLFVIYYEAKTGKLYGYNGSGRAGRNVSIAALKAKGFSAMPAKGIHTVTVPGAVEGWDQLHKKFGKLPWRDLLQPAIYHAKNGFPVTEIIQYDWEPKAARRSRVMSSRILNSPRPMAFWPTAVRRPSTRDRSPRRSCKRPSAWADC